MNLRLIFTLVLHFLSGGHIDGAIHMDSRLQVQQLFEQNARTRDLVAIIFHCEYSIERGPNAWKVFRALDRERNRRPELTFPEVCVMSGGYREFYRQL
jgi:M-phase inducer tyrosine phosphatase